MAGLGNGEIPPWDATGLLPKVYQIGQYEAARSPYRASVAELVRRFGSTGARRELLHGLLDYRVPLRDIGLRRGFQWIDGSMVENLEERQRRSPADLDVVTFFYIPGGYTYQTLAAGYSELFNPDSVVQRYQLDHSFVPLNDGPVEAVIDVAVNWLSLFSFTREDSPKGFVQIELIDQTESDARALLEDHGFTGGLQ